MVEMDIDWELPSQISAGPGIPRMPGMLIALFALSPGQRKWRDGRGDWIRTSDPHTPSVMRYQAALRPDLAAFADGEGASSQANQPRQGQEV